MLPRAPDGPLSLPPVAEATRAATIGLAAAVVGITAAFAALPGARSWLASPGGLPDVASAVLLPITALAAWWGIRRTRGALSSYWPLPAAAILGFLDEVHYGVNIFGFEPPQVASVPLDGVSSVFTATQSVAATDLGLGPLDLAAAAVLAAVVGAFLLARQRRAYRVVAWLADHPPAVHLLAACALVTGAIALDLFASRQIWRFTEEMAEFAAACIMLHGALLIPRHDPEVAGWRWRLRPWLDGETPLRAMPTASAGRPHHP